VCQELPYGSQADIWSIGVVFYELLTLELPFKGQNAPALVMKIISVEPRPFPPEYSKGVHEIVGQMLQKQPEDRPSADELLNRDMVRRSLSARLGAAGDREVLTLPSSSPSTSGSDAVHGLLRNQVNMPFSANASDGHSSGLGNSPNTFSRRSSKHGSSEANEERHFFGPSHPLPDSSALQQRSRRCDPNSSCISLVDLEDDSSETPLCAVVGPSRPTSCAGARSSSMPHTGIRDGDGDPQRPGRRSPLTLVGGYLATLATAPWQTTGR